MINNQFLLCREIKMYSSDSSFTDIVDFAVRYEYDELLWSLTLDLEVLKSLHRVDKFKDRIHLAFTECRNKRIKFSILIRLYSDFQIDTYSEYYLIKDFLHFVIGLKPFTLWTEIDEMNLGIVEDIYKLKIDYCGVKVGIILGHNIINHFCVRLQNEFNTFLGEINPDKICLSFFESKPVVPKEMLKVLNELRIGSNKMKEYELFAGIHGDFTSAYSNSMTEIDLRVQLCRIAGFKRIIFNLPANSPSNSFADLPLQNCFGALLADIKSVFETYDLISLSDSSEIGISVLTMPETISPCSFAELIQRYGIPITFDESNITTAAGKVFCNMNDDEIKNILSGGILLDSVALMELTERGFGDYLGVKPERVFNTHQKAIGPEEYCASIRNKVVQDYIGTYFLSSKGNDWTSNVSVLTPANDAQVMSWILDADRNRVMPASVRFENALGGRVVAYAYDFSRDFFVGAYSWGRGKQIADYLYWLSIGDDFIRCINAPNMIVQMKKTDSVIQLLLLNLSIDKSEKLKFENNYIFNKLEMFNKSTNTWSESQFNLSENECGSQNVETDICLQGLDSTMLRIYLGGN